jgi:hypothetical protein
MEIYMLLNEADSMRQTRVAMAVPSQNEEETQSSIPVNCVKINLVNHRPPENHRPPPWAAVGRRVGTGGPALTGQHHSLIYIFIK